MSNISHCLITCGLDFQESAEAAENITPLRRSGRQTKRKLTKTESSEQVDSSPSRGQNGKARGSSPKGADPPAKQAKRNEATNAGKATRAGARKTIAAETADSPLETTSLSTKVTVKGSADDATEKCSKDQGGVKAPLSPEGNRTTRRTTTTLQNPENATSKTESPKKEVRSPDIKHSIQPPQSVDSNILFSAEMTQGGAVKSQTSGVKAVRASPRKLAMQEKVNERKEGSEGEESEEDKLVILTESKAKKLLEISEASSGNSAVDSSKNEGNSIPVDTRKCEGKIMAQEMVESSEEIIPKISPCVVVQNAPLMTTTTITDSEEGVTVKDMPKVVSMPIQEKVDLVVLGEPEQKEADSQDSRPRRKRVASELLQAAEIAHGLLDDKPRVPTQTGEPSMTTTSKTDSMAGEKPRNMRSLLPSKGLQNVSDHSKTESVIKSQTCLTKGVGTTVQLNSNIDSSLMEETPKVNVVFEKQEDTVSKKFNYCC